MNEGEFKKKFWLSVALSVFFFLLVNLGIWWVSKSVAKESKEISDLRAILNNRSEAVGVLAELKQGSRNVDAYERLMSQLLPTQEDLLNFSRWMETSANTYQVGLVNFSFQGNSVVLPTDVAPGSTGFQMEVTGSLSELIKFADYLEAKTQKYLIYFDSIDTIRQGDNYRLLLTGKVFFK